MRPQSVSFSCRQAEHEVIWKAIEVSLDRLVQSLCRNTVKFSQIRVEQDSLLTKKKDVSLDAFYW